MNKLKILLISIISFTGMFIYKLPHEDDMFYTAQFSFFVLSVTLLFSYLIYKQNKWMGLITCLAGISFVKTLLLEQASKIYMFESFIIGSCIFLTYYVARILKLKEDTFKYFLIPAIGNIVLIFIQKFEHTLLPFIPITSGITGFIGNPGFAALFLGLTTPIFMKYCKWGLIPLFVSILLCSGFSGFMAFLTSGLLYLCFSNKKIFKITLFTILLFGIIFVLGGFYKLYTGEVNVRLGCFSGTIDAIIQRHPIFGWGVGSFVSVMARVKPMTVTYFGFPLNSGTTVLNHPHNEFLFGWWNFGIFFLIFCIGLIINAIKSFKLNNILPFSILVGSFFALNFYFFSMPAWFLLMLSLGIYHNQCEKKED